MSAELEERALDLDVLAYSCANDADRADAFDVSGDAWDEAGFPERAELRRLHAATLRHRVARLSGRGSGKTHRMIEEAVQHAVEHTLQNVLIICASGRNAEDIEMRVHRACIAACGERRSGSPQDIDRRIYVMTAQEIADEPIRIRPVYFGHVLADNEYIEHPAYRGYVGEYVIARVRRERRLQPQQVSYMEPERAPSRRLWRRRV